MATYTIKQQDEGDTRQLVCLDKEAQFTCSGDYGEDGVAFEYDQVEAIYFETDQEQLFFQVEGEVFSLRCPAEDQDSLVATEYFINRARAAWGLDSIELV